MNDFKSNSNSGKRKRSGLTILEAMIAIGVATIGVFGVFATLPVATYQSQLGLIEDHKAFLGQNAFHDFELRGMSHPDMWLYTTMTPVENPPGSGIFEWNISFPSSVRNPGTNPRPPYVPAATSYCIDPRFFFNLAPPTAAGPPTRFAFPNVATGLRMERISLRAGPGLSGMQALLADEVFISNDDLVFDPTDDVLLPAAQEYTPGDTKRQARGMYSWMATVVPKFLDPVYDIDPGTGLPITSQPNQWTDLYTLSIVVFYNREFTGTEERVSTVTTFDGGGVGGGDITITGATPDDVDIKQRNWVMLSQNVPTSQVYTTGMPPMPVRVTVPVHKWYRVIAAETDETGMLLDRHITLAGRDIDQTLATQVTFAKGVVAVYEKTIRLESSSIWNQ